MKMYCIYDRKAEFMNPPFVQENNALAIRQFQIMVNRQGHEDNVNILNMYASDFTLMYLGEFDPKTMKFIAAEPVTLLSTGNEVLTPPPILIQYSYSCRLPALSNCAILTLGKLCITPLKAC